MIADLRKLGLASHVSLGTLHAARDLFGGMAGFSPAAIEHALYKGFHWAFLGCAAVAGLGVLIGLAAKDPMLRTTAHLAPKTGETI